MSDKANETNFQALVIDDEQQVREFVAAVLRGEGWHVTQSPSAEDALSRAHEAPWSVVFCDVTLGGANGYSVLRQFKETLRETKVVLMPGHGSAARAFDATAYGAYDYLLKPFGLEELQSLSQALLIQLSNRPQGSSPARRSAASHSDIELVGRSQAFIEVLKHVGRVSKTNLPVLLMGESGTGKELVAAAIYQRSGRADQPFVTVNCRAIPAELIEAELFGRLWEEAAGGTVFLDEITETTPSFQAKLLHTVQKVDVRVIAASNWDVEQKVRAGRFRNDLFEHLNAASIVLPPLRERPEDIPPLAQSFADRVYSLNPAVKFSAEALALLARYRWPGNIRELENAVVRAVAMCDGTIRMKDLPQRVRNYTQSSFGNGNAAASNGSVPEEWVPLSEIEGRYVAEVLQHTRGNKQAAARVLAVDRKTLDRMIKRHHIASEKARRAGH